MRLLFAGTPENAVPTLQALIDSEHEVVAVLTRAPARSGRGRKITNSPIHILAEQNDIPVLTPATLKTPEAQQEILDLNVDLVVVVAYGNIVPQKLLDGVKHGWINLHFSLLPRFRGAAPVQYAVMNADKITGACVFQLEAGLDTGPIYTQIETEVADKTAKQLLDELSIKGADLVLEAIEKISVGQSPTPQSTQGITLAPKIDVSMGEINFNEPAEKINALLRALCDGPGTYSFVNGKRIKLMPAQICSTADLPAGQIHITKKDVFVGTATFDMRLTKVAPAGKTWMNASDWGRGLRQDTCFQHSSSMQ